MDENRQIAENRLREREAKYGAVTDRERYLQAIVRGLDRKQASQPGAQQASAQAALIERHEHERQALPEPADDVSKVRGRQALASMRQALNVKRTYK